MFSNLKQSFNTPNTTFGFSSNVNPNPFGQSAFGKTPSTGFGAPAPAFGQQSTPLFGQATQHGSLFASAAPTNTFGQTVNTQPTFGTGMFGSTSSQPSGSGLFGAANTSTFGQQNKPTGFGFGTNTANTGFGFGQSSSQVQPQQQSTGLFGQTSSNVFGQSSGFGSNTSNNQVGTVIKFTPVTGTDTMVKGSINQPISTRHHCITCMKEYENKSLEELRWEDYQVNRKGPQQGSQPSGGLFGNMSQPVGTPLFGSGAVATSANTLFGQQENKSVFGQPATATGFGQTTPAFGSTSTSNTGAGLFGKPLSGFGTATTSTAFPFGSTPQTNNLFGSNTAAKTTFGVSTQSNSLFGQPSGFGNPSTFGSFGSTTNQNVGLFNQNKTTPFSIMPTSTTNTFGSFATSAAQNTNSLFSGAKPNTGGFGGFGQTSTAPVFGQPSFGQTNQGLFNSSFKQTTTPLFGQTQTTNTLGTGLQIGGNTSLFGSNVNKPNTMFGNNLGLFNSGFGANSNPGSFNMGGSITQPGVQNPDQSHTNTEQQIINMSSTPYGIPSLLNNISEVSSDLKDCTRPTNPSELNALLNTVTKPQTSAPAEKLKPMQVFGRKVPMFDGLEHRDESLISNIRINNNPKRLIVRNHPNKHKDSLDDSLIKSTSNPLILDSDLARMSRKSLLEDTVVERQNIYPDLTPLQKEKSPALQPKNKKQLETKNISLDLTNTSSSPVSSTMISTPSKVLFLPDNKNDDENDSKEEDGDLFTEASESQDWQTDFNDSVRGVIDDSLADVTDPPVAASAASIHPTGIILTKPEYYTVPSLDELVKYISEDGSCVVKGFTVGRYGYGNVYFSDAFDVSNLNLDELVYFRHKEINIYPDDSKKPPQGQGLNRRAQVTLDKVWPLDKKAKALITDVEILTKMDYTGRLRRLCEKQNTRFVEYRPDTGSWVFKVEHFSKYGHRESDDEDDKIDDIQNIEKGKLIASPAVTKSEISTTASVTESIASTSPSIDSVKSLSLISSLDSYVSSTTTTTDSGKTGTTISLTPSSTTLTSSSFISVSVTPPDQGLRDIVVDVPRHDINEEDLMDYDMQILSHHYDNNTAKCTLMKSTFFEKDLIDYDDNISEVCSSDGGILELSNYVSESSPKRPDIEVYGELDISEPRDIPLDIFNTEIPEPTEKPETISLEDYNVEAPSVMENFCCIADMISFKGRSFRVSWTKELTMLCLAKSETVLNDIVNREEYRSIAIKKLKNVNEDAFKNMEKHLECQFEHSINESINDIPYGFAYHGCNKLYGHQEIAKDLPNDNYEKQIWNLIATLFEFPEEEPSTIAENDLYKTKVEKHRKQKLSKWIKIVVESAVNNEVNDSTKDDLFKILSYISGNKISEAAHLAMDSNNINLAMLISQLPSSKLAQISLRTQLNLWEHCDVLNHLDKTMLKIYAILSGTTLVNTKSSIVLVFEEMDWIRTLALFLWYVTRKQDSLSKAVHLYEKMFDEHRLAKPPTPEYQAVSGNIYDLRFQLLKYYSDSRYPINHLLNTFTYTNDPLDYRLSWFVFQTLSSLNQDQTSTQAEHHMHINFATQLEQMGLWHWAVYILTYIKSNNLKKDLIIDIIGRHVLLRNEETAEYKKRERMLIEKFQIPSKWIESQKALKAIQTHYFKDAVYYSSFAEEWSQAHALALRYSIPTHLLAYDHESLIDLLTPLSEHRDQLSDWEDSGGLILDFANLGVQYNAILSLNDPAAIQKQLISFRSSVINVSVRFKYFKSLSHLHDVCLAEMSGRIAVMLRKLLTLINGHNYELCVDTAINAQTLPITSDYLKQELNAILIDYLHGNVPKFIRF